MSNEETSIELPETLNFTDADRKAVKSFRLLRPGQMRMQVISATRQQAPWEALQIELTLAPVDADGNVRKDLKARKAVNMPITNGKFKPGNLDLFGCYVLASSADPEFPRYPKKTADGSYLLPSGETLTKEEANAHSAKVDEAVREAAGTWWANNGAPLIGVEGYGVVEHQIGKTDGNIYPRVKRFGSEPDQEKEIVTSDFEHTA